MAAFVPLDDGTLATLEAMRQGGLGALRVSPFCHAFAQQVRGWVLDVPTTASASALPLPHNLFHGVSVAMCELPECEVLRLLMAPHHAEETRRRLGAVLSSMQLSPLLQSQEAATWERCRPSRGADGVPRSLYGAQRVRKEEGGAIVFQPDTMHQQAHAIIDSDAWRAQLSPDGFVGLYFRWHEEGARVRLYVACQSYLPRACRELVELVRNVERLGCNGECTAGFVSLSEEVQWLRNASARNRARIIAQVSERMGLGVGLMDDYLASANTPVMQRRMAVVCTETLHHDVRCALGAQTVRVLNYCAETCDARNGSVCTMAPWDPLWIFGGADETNNNNNGDTFGQPSAVRGHTLVLPTATIVTNTPAAQQQTLCFTSAARGRPVMALWADIIRHNHNNNNNQEEEKKPPPPRIKKAAAATTTTLEDDIRLAYQRALALSAWDAASLLRDDNNNEKPENGCRFLVFNEAVLQPMMALFKGQREHNACRLIPLAMGLASDVPCAL